MRVDLWEEETDEISDKRFLSDKEVTRLVLPRGTGRLGNWSLAHMKNLKELEVPCKEILLGKEVFKGCDKLCRIIVREGAGRCDRLLAVAVRYLSEKLFCPNMVGQEAWYERFDEVLLGYLTQDEVALFKPMWFGGEEDYDDNDTNLNAFLKERARQKFEVILERLREATFLKKETKELLWKHAKELHALYEDDLLEWYDEQYPSDAEMARVLAELSLVTTENMAMVLAKLPNLSAEGKAILLGHVNGSNNDFYDALDL